MISDKFDKALYINLAYRKDRREKTEKEFASNGVIAERVEAIEGNPDNLSTSIMPGHVGCVLSHLKCLEMAKANKWKTLLVFEDDVEFRKSADSLFNVWWEEVPDDWDMVYLGGNHYGHILRYNITPVLTKVTEHVYYTFFTITTHAFVIKDTMYDYMIKKLKTVEKEVDRLYVDAQIDFNVYTFRPNLAWQRNDYSDINNESCNYDWMRD